jgi:hypothetical protein
MRRRRKVHKKKPQPPVLIDTAGIEFELMMAELTEQMRFSAHRLLTSLVAPSSDAYFYCDQSGDLRLLTQK